MTVIQYLPYALFCMGVVFAVLIVLSLIIKVFSFIIGLLSDRIEKPSDEYIPAADENTPATPQISGTSTGQLTLQNVDEPTAAIIMAVISQDLGMSLNELIFKSIKLVKE